MTPRRLGVVSALLAGTVVAGAGCGSSGSARSTISPAATASLTRQVSAVRAAVSRRDRTGAKSDLDQLRATVATLGHQGQVSPARSSLILAAAADVETQLATLFTSTSGSTAGTASNTVPAPSGPDVAGNTGSTRTTAKAPEPSGDGGKGRGKDPKHK